MTQEPKKKKFKVCPDDLFTVGDIANAIGVNKGIIGSLANRGKLKFKKVIISGTNFYIVPESIRCTPNWGIVINHRTKKTQPNQ